MKTGHLLYLVLFSVTIRAAFGYIRACFYTNWSQFSPNTLGRFTPAKVPAQLCTHIVFAYADIRATNVTPTEFNDIQMYSRLNSIRRYNPTMKLILALGGWAAGGVRFSRLVSNDASMEQFADNTASYLRRFSFDGVLIDWEYPGVQTGPDGILDRLRFTRLLQILADSFTQEASVTRRRRLTLSAALEVNVTEARTFYEIDKIGRYLDLAYIMAYDLHGQWDRRSGALHHAALHPDIVKYLDLAYIMAYDLHGQWDRRSGALHHAALHPDISDFVEEWIDSGISPNKIVLGVTAFGRSFTLASAPVGTALGQPVVGGGTPGAYSRTRGMLNFGEICLKLQRRGWRRIWMGAQGVPIALGNSTDGWQWVGYDDPRSMALKARFVRQQNLAGIMLWSLDHDDHSNLCRIGPWPLLRTLVRELPKESRLRQTATYAPPPKAPTTTPTPVIRDEQSRQESDSGLMNDVTTPSLIPGGSGTLSPTGTNRGTANSIPETDAQAPSQHTAITPEPSVEDEAKDGIVEDTSSDNDNENETSSHQRADSVPETQAVAGVGSTVPDVNVWDKSSITEDPGYKHCRMSQTIGTSMRCPPSRGKPGNKYTFYLFCADSFFAIECHCLDGYFFNRCTSMCDLEQNFEKCPMTY